MGNNRKITLIDGYKDLGEVELICAFEVKNLPGKYIIYSRNEHDKDGNTIIYSGKIVKIGSNQFIESIKQGEEWETIKKILKSIARYSLEVEKNV